MASDALHGKTALITGAGRAGSVAHGIARAFALTGCNIAVTGRAKRALNDACSALEHEGADVLALAFDGMDAERVPALVEQVLERFGGVDVLVTCGAYAPVGLPLAQVSDDALSRSLTSAVRVPAAFMRACQPVMERAGGGSIVNIVSSAAASPTRGMGAPAAGAAALLAYARVAAVEWAACGITVNAVCPLAQNAQLKRKALDAPDAYDELIDGVALGRLADACDDVGATCVFLASEGARCITGQTLFVDGGFHLNA